MATEDATRGRGPDDRGVQAEQRPLPSRETYEKVLAKMLLIRRFEERAGEMYAKAKIGGFLHLCIGEEATVVGATQALRDTDFLMSTYREHGQALARGTEAKVVMAELFGKVDGCSGGRGGSMHLFDFERRFLGGYGIVGGNLPLAAGVALASDYTETEDATLCMFGDGATNQGTFGETMNLAALWHLPIVFMVITRNTTRDSLGCRIRLPRPRGRRSVPATTSSADGSNSSGCSGTSTQTSCPVSLST